ncbi:hypothetical protein [Flavobacterium cupreum]
MNVTRAILPYFRAKKGGIIINTTSMGELITLYNVYHGTKMGSLRFHGKFKI